MKKRISKNIFLFSILIIELKNEKEIFLNLFWFKTNFKKRKSKFSQYFFDLKPKNEFQNIVSFFDFGFEIAKWKLKIFYFFLFLNQKRIILSVHGFHGLLLNFTFRFVKNQKLNWKLRKNNFQLFWLFKIE